MSYLNTTHLKTLSLIGLFILVMAFYLTTCGSTESIAQKGKEINQKPIAVDDSIPKPIIYTYSFDAKTARAVDSILIEVWKKIGYPLPKKEGDELQSGLGQIINYFAYQRSIQDSIRNGKLKTKPLKK